MKKSATLVRASAFTASASALFALALPLPPADASTSRPTASHVCGLKQGVYYTEMCVVAASIAGTQSTPGFRTTVSGSVQPWTKTTTTESSPGAGNRYDTYRSNTLKRNTIVGTVNGRSNVGVRPGDTYYDYNDITDGTSRSVSVQYIGSGRTYHYKQWESYLISGFDPAVLDDYFRPVSLYSDFPSCVQVGTSRNPLKDCQNGTVAEWRNAKNANVSVTVSSTAYKGTIKIIRDTVKVSNGHYSAPSAPSATGNFTFYDKISGSTRLITTTWKLGTAPTVTEHITASFADLNVLKVKSTL